MNIKIKNSRYFADGFCPETNTIYEYDGDYFHGNPKLYNGKDLNTPCNKTFGELYQKTLDKRNYCIANGYNFISIWEDDWKLGIKAIKFLQRKFRSSHIRAPKVKNTEPEYTTIQLDDDIIEDVLNDATLIEDILS